MIGILNPNSTNLKLKKKMIIQYNVKTWFDGKSQI